ncbi:hypothetical protein ACJMK2_028897, partial [Sinanodonta woodiana]
MQDFAVCVGLILCSVLTLAKGKEYYLLTSPRYLRFGVNETLSVSYHGDTSLTLTILLRYEMKEFSVRQITLNRENPQILDVEVTRKDLGLDDKASFKPRFVDLVVKSRLARSRGEDIKQMLISYNTGYLFIQTDKPIYSPGFGKDTKVFIRVMALDENFKPSVGKNVTVEITDSRGVLMTKNTKHFVDFIRDEMILDSLAAKGIWIVRAKFEDELETETYAFFEVKEYVIPTFEVIITSVSHRYISDRLDYLRIKVKSIYVYGKPVRGTCFLRLKLKDEEGNETKLNLYYPPKQLDNNGQVEFTIDVKTGLRSVLPESGYEGKRLVLDATVQETTTGNTQTVRDQSVFFSNNPYVLKFFRSSSSFQPDFPYKLHIDVLHLAGDPAANINLQVQIDGKNQTITTDENGRALYSLNTKKSSLQLLFQIKPHESSEIIPHIVKKYDGKHYLQLTVTKQPLQLEARTDSGANGSGGLVILTSSRGRLYDSAFFLIRGIKTHNLSPWQHQMISSGRSIAYFIDENGEVVADQIKYDVQRTCLTKELTVTLKDHKVEYYPGQPLEMTVTGVNNSRVGLGVIDKAVLLVSNRSNLFERSQMFDKIDAHDRGCTYGGGVNGSTVFRDAGMVVLTNARLIMESNTNVNCPASTNQRRKRSTDEDLQICCKEGEDYANSIDEMTACVHKVLKKHNEGKKSSACLNKFLECCRDAFPEGRSSGADKIAFDFDQTAKDLKIAIRDQFQESWMFDEYSIGSNGELKVNRPTPHSITEWRVQAIGMSSEYGICIAEPVTFKTFKNFFLQVDLPYKAVRLEQMNIKVTIFNYDVNNYLVNVYVEPWDSAICASTKMGVRSEAISVLVKAKDASTVTYPILPLKANDTYLTVYGVATGEKLGMNINDAVWKKLHIVNEGIEENEKIQLCLDPNQGRKTICTYNKRVIVENDVVSKVQIFTVNLTMPDNAIQDTGKGVIYLTGNNIMDIVVQNTIKDVDKLFAEAQPYHCGEQTMVFLAPTVYAMMYLDKTKQLINGSEIEKNGFNLIKKGIMQMKKYKKKLGAYSVWTDSIESTWLTAYVLKVYCQTDKLNDALNQTEDIRPGLEWLVRYRQNADGLFTERYPVYHIYKDSNTNNLFVTAYALITLQECRTSDKESKTVNNGIEKAMKYVERTYRTINDTYVLAIAAYALAISQSSVRTDANNQLKLLSRTTGQDFRYWGLEGEAIGYASAITIETTCYALLTQLEFDDLQYAQDIVNWLAAKINSHGSFRSTQDTVVCLQALSSYNIRTYNPILDLHVTVLADGYSQTKFVTQTNTIATPLKKIPVGKTITVQVRGKGDGRMFIDFVYNRKKEQNDVCNFSIEISSNTIYQDKASKIRNSGCDICGNCPNDNTTEEAHNRFGRSASSTSIKYCITVNVSYIPKTEQETNAGMSIVDIGIQTGFKLANEQDLKDMVNTTINHFEMPGDTRDSLILYVNMIPKKPDVLTFMFTVTKQIEVVNKIQPAAVSVYQYDDPDKKCVKFYSLMEGSSGELSSACQGQVCECLE